VDSGANMTDQEFADGVNAIIEKERGHAAHRKLDELWTRYALERGGIIADATLRWMKAIEGQHAHGLPYPNPRD
jgi:hypothetical protein